MNHEFVAVMAMLVFSVTMVALLLSGTAQGLAVSALTGALGVVVYRYWPHRKDKR